MKTNIKTEIPAGAVMLRQDDAPEYTPRTGAERVNELGNDGGVPVFAIWPSNRQSKATPEHGPFVGKCRETGRDFIYYTHVLPDKDGVFLPAKYDLFPPMLAERIDEAQTRRANLPPALQDLIAAQRRGMR